MEDSRALTDEELVESARVGARDDLRPFELLVERYQGRVVANCRHIGGSPADAEDLAQEVFVKTFFGLARFEGRSSFKTWLYRIKANHCINFLKKTRKASVVDLDDQAAAAENGMQVPPSAETRVASRDQRVVIEHILDSMPETLRIPLVMRDADEMSYQEIADALEIGLSAAKMRIKRGREMFRERFAESREPGADVEPSGHHE